MRPIFLAREVERATAVGDYPRPNRTFGAARYCVTCYTPLSIYNPERTCAIHTKPKYSQEKGYPLCQVCKERVPRTEFVSIRRRCKTCDRKKPWEKVA